MLTHNRIPLAFIVIAFALYAGCATTTSVNRKATAPYVAGEVTGTPPRLDPNHMAHIGQAYYPRESLAVPEEGICKMSVTIEPDGTVSASHLVESSNFPRLDTACENAFPEDVRFIPATKDGVEIKATATIPIVWCLGVDCHERLSRSHASSKACKIAIQTITDSKKPDEGQSFLRLVGIAPAKGSMLYPDSVLAADLEYWVKDFQPGQFKIMAQFSLQDRGRSTDGDFPSSDYPVLTAPAGRVHFCFPIAYVWNRPLEVPFDVRFFLNRFEGDSRNSSVLAHTDHLQFPSSK